MSEHAWESWGAGWRCRHCLAQKRFSVNSPGVEYMRTDGTWAKEETSCEPPKDVDA